MRLCLDLKSTRVVELAIQSSAMLYSLSTRLHGSKCERRHPPDGLELVARAP